MIIGTHNTKKAVAKKAIPIPVVLMRAIALFPDDSPTFFHIISKG
jgi:hypothetical protein